MSFVEWAQVLLPIGAAIGAGILIGWNWKEFNRWFDRTIELL